MKSKLPPDENTTYDQEFEQEWSDISIMTQLIGPSTATTEQSVATNLNEDLDNQVNKTLDGLKKEFLSHTDLLDRGEHLEALDRAVSRCRILARLRITIQPQANTTNNLSNQLVYCTQPQVLEKEDPDFQAEWHEAKLKCELILIEVLRRHLTLRVIGKSQNRLRDLSKSV